MMRPINNRGFTLAELLVGMAILLLIMAGLSGVLSTGIMSMQHNLSLGRISAPARHAVNAIEDSLRYNAVAITLPAVGGSGSQLTFSDSSSVEYTISRNSTSRSIVFTKAGIVESTLASGLVESLVFERGTDKREITIKATFNDKSNANSPSRTIKAVIIVVNLGKTS